MNTLSAVPTILWATGRTPMILINIRYYEVESRGGGSFRGLHLCIKRPRLLAAAGGGGHTR